MYRAWVVPSAGWRPRRRNRSPCRCSGNALPHLQLWLSTTANWSQRTPSLTILVGLMRRQSLEQAAARKPQHSAMIHWALLRCLAHLRPCASGCSGEARSCSGPSGHPCQQTPFRWWSSSTPVDPPCFSSVRPFRQDMLVCVQTCPTHRPFYREIRFITERFISTQRLRSHPSAYQHH